MAQEHDNWVASLGFDIGAAMQKAAGAVAGVAEAAGGAIVHGAEAIGAGALHVGEAVVGEAETLGKEAWNAVSGAGHAAVEKVHETVSPDYAKTKKCVELDDAFETQIKRMDAQVKRLTDAALDATHQAAQAKQLRADHAAAGLITNLDAKVAALTKLVADAKTAADLATKDNDRATKSGVEGIDKAVTDMRDAARKLIDKLPRENDQKPGLNRQLTELNADIEAEAKITDRAARNKQLKVLERTAEALLDGAGKAANDPAAVQETYKQALLDRYGFKIDDTHGVSTHNDRVYKMFDMVPDADVTQDKLTMLQYSTKMPDGTDNPSAFYWGGNGTVGPEITMGAYTGTEQLPYQDPTSKTPETPNAFDISTLHELGHSVDDRYGLMSSHGGKAGAGGWQSVTVDTVAQAYIGRFKSSNGKSVTTNDSLLYGRVTTSLSKGTVTRVAGITDVDWPAVSALLTTCATRINGSPWVTEDDIAGRSYHQSGSGWVSYLTASRAMALSVSTYQWRSPAEFFAELYAWTYYNSKAPPGPVESALKDYMFGGTAAAAPAKH